VVGAAAVLVYVAQLLASIIIAVLIGAGVAASVAVAVLVIVARRQRGCVVKPGTVALPRPARAISAAVVHQHLHLHGVDADDLAAIIRQQQSAAWPAIEDNQQH
jgi:hypothetical protein